jgi:very-short-patch-repair endonuclease
VPRIVERPRRASAQTYMWRGTLKTNVALLIGLVVLAVIVLAFLKQRGTPTGDSTGPWPFYVKRPLTQVEQVLYHRLIRALPDHIVLAQVQVSRVLGVKRGSNFHEWNNRINRLSYDFVVCGTDSTVIAVIELDDKSHDTPERGKTDDKKDKATADAGLRLIRWHVATMPTEDTIRRELLPALNAPASAASDAAASRWTATP